MFETIIKIREHPSTFNNQYAVNTERCVKKFLWFKYALNNKKRWNIGLVSVCSRFYIEIRTVQIRHNGQRVDTTTWDIFFYYISIYPALVIFISFKQCLGFQIILRVIHREEWMNIYNCMTVLILLNSFFSTLLFTLLI